MEILKANVGSVRVPGLGDKVFKDECLYSFDSPESDTGLYVCLNKFIGVGRPYLEKYHQRTGSSVFLHLKKTKKEPSGETEAVPEKVSRLAINMEGGFNTENKPEWDLHQKIVVMPTWEELEVSSTEFPLQVHLSVAGVITAVSATKQAQLDAASSSWDGEALVISKFAENLPQNPDPPKIPPKGWKCEKCDLTNNLWLNLTDGSILCGRRFFDGSGGNNHAVEHYEEDRQNRGPLAVKLGTITHEGKGDVFSYAEDNMVLDPYLEKHMAHFGIKISGLEITDKSMVEIEIDMNQRIGEWAILTEAGNKLEPVSGPGHTGLHNLGNTCYMNSVIQLLFSIPAFTDLYDISADMFLDTADLRDPASDLKLQLAKLCRGLQNGRYSGSGAEDVLREEGSQPGISPQMFRQLIGKGHPDFSSKHQQDAQEFYLHFLEQIERTHVNSGVTLPSRVLKFSVADRFECSSSGQVKYVTRNESFLPLSIALDDATNKAEVEEYNQKKAEAEARGERLPDKDVVRANVPFQACLNQFLGYSLVEFNSPAVEGKTTAKKTMRLLNFPNYLLVQLLKFDLDDNWQPIKLDVEVNMPDSLDLSSLRGVSSPQPGEVPLPDNTVTPAAVTIDTGLVAQLADMGFAVEGCRRAVYHTKSSGVEAAMAWVMDHMEDPEFGTPFTVPGTKAQVCVPDEESLALVMSMGISRKQAEAGLRNTQNNVERAVDWIFSHPEGDLEEAAAPGPASGAQTEQLTDGEPRYELAGFISHMGTSVHAGHYVVHIREGSRWLIFNDNKVAVSENPPKGLGYLYLYKRADVQSH